ncbi:MAG TPA: hypothetical protein VMW32_09515 [Bacteroidales bacterium]|nr:hypothetical protein [Bacteroidales bacterium]
MKERPILFSTLMVQALLAGNKTQTRRVIKEPYQSYPCVTKHLTSCEFDFHYDHGVGQFTASPYGKLGDILWVRETWGLQRSDFEPMDVPFYCYKADDETYLPKWRPSIFMPKAVCRIKLQITDIRVERLQNISEGDAIAEGVKRDRDGWKSYEIIHIGKYKGQKHPHSCVPNRSPITSYKELWESINGIDSWSSKPWVWVITFKKL